MILFTWIFTSVVAAHSKTASDFTQVFPVWKALGWRDITVVVPKLSPKRATSIVKLTSEVNITSSVIDKSELAGILAQESTVSFVTTYLVFYPAILLFQEIRQSLGQFRRPYSIMLIDNEIGVTTLDNYVGDLRISAGFFKAKVKSSGGVADLTRIQTFQAGGSYVSDKWILNKDNSSYHASYQMQGHELTAVSKTWEPWLIMDEEACANSTDSCPSKGVLTDIFDTLGKEYNFTWTLTVPEDGEWGSVPDNVTDGLQASDFYGALGEVVNKKHDVGLSVWLFISERFPFIDYTTSVGDASRILIVDSEKVYIDLTLFVRPFTPKSWLIIIIFVGLFVTFLLSVPNSYQWLEEQRSLSSKAVILMVWLFFILTSSYYGGALTMFFSSPPSQPFSSLDEGLSKYPTWELVMQDGLEAHIVNRANRGIQVYQEWIRRAAVNKEDEEKKLILPTIRESLMKLQSGRYFTHVERPQVSAYLNNNPIPGFTPTQIGHPEYNPGLVVVAKNSPVTVMLNEGLQRLRRAGTLSHMLERRLLRLPGQDSTDSFSMETTALGLKEMAAVFLCGIFFLVLSLSVWAAEVLWSRGRKDGQRRWTGRMRNTARYEEHPIQSPAPVDLEPSRYNILSINSSNIISQTLRLRRTRSASNLT